MNPIRRSFGFDPFGLGSVPANLQRFQEAELVHSRYALHFIDSSWQESIPLGRASL